MSLKNSLIHMEAIAQQGYSKLHSDLVEACTELKEVVTKKGISGCNRLDKELEVIEKVIAKHTNVKTTFSVDPETYANAYIMLQEFGMNHPFFKWIHDHYAVGKSEAGDSVRKVLKTAKVPEGWVDRKTSTVHGVFKEFNFDIHITYGLVVHTEPEAAAAVILHELGHGFTQFEYLSGVMTRNYALGAMAQGIMNTENIQERVKLINEIESEMDLKDIDAKELANSKNATVLSTYFFNAAIKPYYSSTGNYFYDTSGCEVLADQFAARHGAGRALVNGLAVMYNDSVYISSNTMTRFFKVVMEIIFHVLFTILTSGSWPFILLLILILTPYEVERYDTPKDRIKKIIDQAIDALKDPSMDEKTKKRYVNDIRNMEATLKTFVNYEGIITRLSRFVFPSFRKAVNNKEFQQVIEDLAYSRLLTTAAEFELKG